MRVKKVVAGERKDLERTDEVALVNFPIATCFSAIAVSLNSIPIETHVNLSYPHIVSWSVLDARFYCQVF